MTSLSNLVKKKVKLLDGTTRRRKQAPEVRVVFDGLLPNSPTKHKTESTNIPNKQKQSILETSETDSTSDRDADLIAVFYFSQQL